MKIGYRLFAMVIVIGCTVSALAQESKLKLPEIKYETYTLPNGLKVITHEDHRLPLVSVDLWYHVGPLNERAGRTGFAHLYEHMMFEGSVHVGVKAYVKIVQGAGATDVNAGTEFDRTNYFETMPANQLELALWLESDRMGFLLEGLDRKVLQNQRDVVRNERRQGEGQPYEVANETLIHELFPKEHPYYGNVIGSHKDIEAARIADIRDFHQQFYTPNNASIAIVGDFNPAKLKELLNKYFGPIPSGPKVESVNVPTPAITKQRRVTVTDTVTLPQLEIAWLTPARFTPGAEDVELAMFTLGEGKVSRLNRALIYETQVAQSVRCSVDGLKLTGIAQCSITAKPGVKLADLEATVWSEIGKLQKDGPTVEEVEAAKAMALSRKIEGLQRPGGYGGVADTLDLYNQYTGDPGYLPKDLAATEAVTKGSLQAAAVKYFAKDSAAIVECVPGQKVLDDVPRSSDNTDADVKLVNPYTEEFEKSQEWRKTMPKAGPAITLHLPVPQMFTLTNGLKVYVVEQKALPVLSATVVSLAGSENNPESKAGLATLTAQTMGEATKTLGLTELSSAQERIGTRIGLVATMDGATGTMTVLTNHTAEGMRLLADVMKHPAFNSDDLERLRKQRLIGFQQETDNVQAMASRVGPKLIFGDTPYGASGTGTTDTVKVLTLDDVKNFYAAHYGPKDSALVLVGDLTMAAARKLAEENFNNWAGAAGSEVTVPPTPKLPATHVVIIDKPGAPQTALQAYGMGVAASTPDLAAIGVMNYTLGGSFASRINMNLREEHGYTYSSNSQYLTYGNGGLFVAGGLVRTDITGPAAKELMGEITKFRSSPSTEAELTLAKEARIQSLPGQFETTEAIAGLMAGIFLYGRPLDYFATLPTKYRTVTEADVMRAAKEYIHPDQLVIVTAGDRTKIEPQLKEAGVGPIEVRDALGNLAK
jgi:zinc protease